MKPSPQTIPPAGIPQNPQPKPFPARGAALLLASVISGCGAAQPAQTPYTETNGHAEMVVVTPEDLPRRSLRERISQIMESEDIYRVYPDGEEGNFGSPFGGWTFRIIESESSERARLFTYSIFSNRTIMGSGDAEPVMRTAVTSTINPNFNVPLQQSEYTTQVGSDVFIFAIQSMVIFNFYNPNTGKFEKRAADLTLPEETQPPEGATIAVAYGPEEKIIEVYYISGERALVVQFSLFTTNTSIRQLE